MSRNVPEAQLDDAAATGNHRHLDRRRDRFFALQREAEERGYQRRADVLGSLGLAYSHRAAAIRARLAGNIADALNAEALSDGAVLNARSLVALPWV